MARIALTSLLLLLGLLQPRLDAADKTVRVTAFASDLTGVSTFAQSFDPDSYSLMSQVHDGLLANDLDGNLVPGLATEWHQIDDLTWEFKLRPDVLFHNGTPFSAKDVKFTYDTLLDPNVASGSAWILNSIAEVQIVDDATVRIKTKAPDGMLLRRLTMFGLIHSKDYTEQVGLEKAKLNPIGTGPFRYVGVESGRQYILKANASYWRKAIPAYDTLLFKILPQDTWEDALMADQVDLVPDLSGRKTQQVVRNPQVDVAKRLVLMSYWVLMRNQGPLADPNVRRALNYALDRTTLVRVCDQGNGVPQASLGLKGGFGTNTDLQPYAYDVKLAKKLLADAGYPEGFRVRMLAADVTEAVAKAIQVQLGDVGVQVDLEVVTRPEWSNRVIVGKVSGHPYDGDMAVNLVDNPIIDTAFHAGLFLNSTSPWALLSSPEYDDKFAWAMSASNQQEHESRVKELDRYIYDNALMLFTYQKIRTVGFNKRIKLPGVSVNGHLDFFMLSDITFRG